MKRYFYGRVSTRDQNLARQLAAARAYAEIPEENIFCDKESGKDFDRTAYQGLKAVLRPGDELIVKELDRLGRNKEEIKDELRWMRENKIIVRILNLPTTLMEFPVGQEWVFDMVNNILIEVLGTIAEQEREKILERQAEGIAAMPIDENGRKISARTGRGFGRPKLAVEADKLPGETVAEACERLGISRRTWYRLQETSCRA